MLIKTVAGLHLQQAVRDWPQLSGWELWVFWSVIALNSWPPVPLFVVRHSTICGSPFHKFWSTVQQLLAHVWRPWSGNWSRLPGGLRLEDPGGWRGYRTGEDRNAARWVEQMPGVTGMKSQDAKVGGLPPSENHFSHYTRHLLSLIAYHGSKFSAVLKWGYHEVWRD